MQRPSLEIGTKVVEGRYEIRSFVGDGHSGEVYSALDLQESPPKLVAIKRIDLGSSSQDAASRLDELHRECLALTQLGDSAIVRIHNLYVESDAIFIVEEFLAGGNLDERISKAKKWQADNNKRGALSGIEIAHIGLLLARGLGDVHGRGAFHGDIKPTNIGFRDKEQSQPVLVDFGQSGFTDAVALHESGGSQRATLPYLPPEVSGFSNEVEGVPCDLYSLGVTLYQCAVGEVPFADRDPKVIIRRILTEVPPPVCAVVPGFPEPLSEIIDKLMRKQPIDRYHTAVGLAADLDSCLESLQRGDIPPVFALGRKDKIRELNYRIPMIGRHEEIARLRAGLTNSSAGNGGVFFIAAPSGTGKSRLSLEFAAEARDQGIGTLLTKFSEFERNLPFSAIHSLVHDFTYRLAKLSVSELGNWKQRVRKRLQGRGRLLAERFADLAPLLPEFPPLPRVEHEEMLQMFLETLAEFLTLLDGDEKGQIVILDDLQWADSSSLDMLCELQKLSVDGALGKTLVIGTFRSNEVHENHPLMTKVLFDTCKEQRIELGPLSREESQTLIEHIIDERGAEVDKLVDFTFRLTQGNPFFSYEYMKSLISSEVYALQEDGTWVFNEARRSYTVVSTGMAELVSARIRKLPQLEREALIVASIVGSKFPLHLLSRLIERQILGGAASRSISELEQYRQETPEVLTRYVQSQLVAQHLILHDEVNFIFFHDKVREAAIALASKESTAAIHQACGEYLAMECLSLEMGGVGKAPSQNLYDAAFHFMRGTPSLTKHPARRVLLLAAQRAVQIFAFQKALDYLETASKLFDGNPRDGLREQDKAEWIAINELMADALGLSRRVDEAISLFEEIYELSDDPLHKAEICAKRVDYNLALFRYKESICAGKDGLKQVGYHPIDSELRAIAVIVIWTPWLIVLCVWFWLFGKQTKKVTDPKDVIRLKLMIAYQVPTYFSRPLIAIAQHYPLTRELLYHEDSYFRSMVIAYWGVVTANVGMPRTSKRCFRKAAEYFDKHPNPIAQGFVLFIWGYLLDFPCGRLVEAQSKIEKAYESLAGVGESFWHYLSLMGLMHFDYFGLGSGQAMVAGSKLISLWEQVQFEPCALASNLKGFLYEGRADDVERWIRIAREAGDRVESQGFETIDLVYSYLLPGEVLLLTGHAEKAVPLLEKAFRQVLSHLHRVALCSYSAPLLACGYVRTGRLHKAIFPLVVSYLNPLLSVSLFQPQTLYVTGEFLMKLGLFSLGRRVFERGIRYARVRGWVPVAAEGWLTLAELLVDKDPDRADDYLRKSIAYFSSRGHKFLVERARSLSRIAQANIEALTPNLATGGESGKTTNYTLRSEIETSALLEIFLELSSLSQIESILDAVIDALCRCTGAEIGIIFSNEDGVWVPTRSTGVEHDCLLHGHFGMAGVDKGFFDHCVSHSIVEARVRPSMAHSHELKGSALVLPLAYKGRTSGMCYLANRQIANLFDQKAIETIGPVAAQAAIALHNVELLAETQNKARMIFAHTERLKTLVTAGQSIAAQVDFASLSRALVGSLRKFFADNLNVHLLIHATCLPESEADYSADIYHMLNDDGSCDVDFFRRADELAEFGVTFAVFDPRESRALAYVCLSHSNVEEIEKLRPIVEAICTNVASALTTVRLEQVLRIFEERTRDIRTLFENINQGICMIDGNLQIGRNLSKQMDALFGDSIAGESIERILEVTNLAADHRQMILAVLDSAIGFEAESFIINDHILPRESFVNEDDQKRFLELDWTPIVDDNDIIRRVMLTIRDVTEFRKLREAASVAAMEVECFREVLAANPIRLKDFFADLDQLLATMRAVASRVAHLDDRDKAILKRDIHTLKGTGRLLRLTAITDSIHALESSVIEALDSSVAQNQSFQKMIVDLVAGIVERSTDYHRVEATLRSWSDSHRDQRVEKPISACLAALNEIEARVAGLPVAQAVRSARGHLLELDFSSLQSIVTMMHSVACDIAAKELEKPKPRLECEMPSVWLLQPHAGKVVSECLNHIFRNIVDHGLTQDEEGVIRVCCRDVEDGLLLDVSSSEQGLHLAALEVKIAGGKAGDEGKPTDEELAELVFISGVSTAKSVSQISGRGIGMDAVRSMLTELGGSISIDFRGPRTRHGRRPFSFLLHLPRDIVEFAYENGGNSNLEEGIPARRTA